MNNNDSQLSSQNRQTQQINTFLSSTLLKLQSRIQNLQIKLMSLNKVVRLLQHYTQKKDQLHQKQTNNLTIINLKFNQLTSLHRQMTQSLSICDELKSHLKLQTLKIQQTNINLDNHHRLIKQKDENLYQTQLRLNEELNMVKDKINKIQSNFLKQIRLSTKKNQEEKYEFNDRLGEEERMVMEDMRFRVDRLQGKVKVEMEGMKVKVEKVMRVVKRYMQADDYGLMDEKRVIFSSKTKRKDASNVKRLKSK